MDSWLPLLYEGNLSAPIEDETFQYGPWQLLPQRYLNTASFMTAWLANPHNKNVVLNNNEVFHFRSHEEEQGSGWNLLRTFGSADTTVDSRAQLTVYQRACDAVVIQNTDSIMQKTDRTTAYIPSGFCLIDQNNFTMVTDDDMLLTADDADAAVVQQQVEQQQVDQQQQQQQQPEELEAPETEKTSYYDRIQYATTIPDHSQQLLQSCFNDGKRYDEIMHPSLLIHKGQPLSLHDRLHRHGHYQCKRSSDIKSTIWLDGQLCGPAIERGLGHSSCWYFSSTIRSLELGWYDKNKLLSQEKFYDSGSLKSRTISQPNSHKYVTVDNYYELDEGGSNSSDADRQNDSLVELVELAELAELADRVHVNDLDINSAVRAAELAIDYRHRSVGQLHQHAEYNSVVDQQSPRDNGQSDTSQSTEDSFETESPRLPSQLICYLADGCKMSATEQLMTYYDSRGVVTHTITNPYHSYKDKVITTFDATGTVALTSHPYTHRLSVTRCKIRLG